METKNLTIVFVDLAGYTVKTSHITRNKLLEHLETYEKIVEPVFSDFKGSIVKRIGDAFMASFESPTNAVLCGIKIQDKLFKYNQTAPEKEKIHVRIAINTGEAHIRNGDIYGEPVNIASRLEKAAKVNDVYFTEAVYLSMNKAEIPSVFVGNIRFKGVPRKIKIFKVLGEYSEILLERKIRQKRHREIIKGILLILSSVIAIASILASLYFIF